VYMQRAFAGWPRIAFHIYATCHITGTTHEWEWDTPHTLLSRVFHDMNESRPTNERLSYATRDLRGTKVQHASASHATCMSHATHMEDIGIACHTYEARKNESCHMNA